MVFCFFAGLAFALLLLVFELAEVHDLGDRRAGVGRDFNEVESSLVGKAHAFLRTDHSNIFTFSTNQAHFGCTDLVIDTGSGVALWRRVMRSAGYVATPCMANTFSMAAKLMAAAEAFNREGAESDGLITRIRRFVDTGGCLVRFRA